MVWFGCCTQTHMYPTHNTIRDIYYEGILKCIYGETKTIEDIINFEFGKVFFLDIFIAKDFFLHYTIRITL